MEVDSVTVADGLESQDFDDDIQVLACYRENTPFSPQFVAGRAMTTELKHCLNDLNIPDEDLIESISTFTDPSQDLLDWCAGGPPRIHYDSSVNNHPIVQCGHLNPIRDSPWSPPLEDQRPSNDVHQLMSLYQMMPEGNEKLPAPGILPI